MISRSDWMRAAEYEAARTYGKKYAGAFMFRRFLAGPAGVLLAVGALGYGAYWAWTRVAEVFAGGMSAPSISVWAVAGMLVVATAVAYRPGRLPTFGPAPWIKAIMFVLTWLGLIAYMIGTIG